MLNIQNLSVRYGKIIAVRGCDLRINDREIVALLGANGAGKSSVMKALSGLIECEVDNFELYGKKLNSWSSESLVRKGVALVLEGEAVLPSMNVIENIKLGGGVGRLVNISPKKRRLIDEVLEIFPRLGERKYQTAGSLSGGEKRMLAIARAIVMEARLLLLDEPSQGLSPRIVKEVARALRDLRDERKMALLVTEQNAVLGAGLADRIYVMQNGRVEFEGSKEDLEHNREQVSKYLIGAGE